MTTVSGGLIAPDGYTRNSYSWQSVACNAHDRYTPFCNDCSWVPVATAHSLGADCVAMILDRECGSVIEILDGTEYGPDIAHLAHEGIVVIAESERNNPSGVVSALMHEAALYADCFGTTDTLPESEDS